MYKNVLQHIDNVAIWPVISFVIFFFFFICLLWWVFTTDKKTIHEIEILPLQDTKPGSKQNSNTQYV
jgi:cytochrome c oxidase cbb3-type subunit 4